MEKKLALAFILVVFIVSVSLEVPVSAQIGCVDACQTACVSNRDDRVRARCDRKCLIKCDPDPAVKN